MSANNSERKSYFRNDFFLSSNRVKVTYLSFEIVIQNLNLLNVLLVFNLKGLLRKEQGAKKRNVSPVYNLVLPL